MASIFTFDINRVYIQDVSVDKKKSVRVAYVPDTSEVNANFCRILLNTKYYYTTSGEFSASPSSKSNLLPFHKFVTQMNEQIKENIVVDEGKHKDFMKTIKKDDRNKTNTPTIKFVFPEMRSNWGFSKGKNEFNKDKYTGSMEVSSVDAEWTRYVFPTLQLYEEFSKSGLSFPTKTKRIAEAIKMCEDTIFTALAKRVSHLIAEEEKKEGKSFDIEDDDLLVLSTKFLRLHISDGKLVSDSFRFYITPEPDYINESGGQTYTNGFRVNFRSEGAMRKENVEDFSFRGGFNGYLTASMSHIRNVSNKATWKFKPVSILVSKIVPRSKVSSESHFLEFLDDISDVEDSVPIEKKHSALVEFESEQLDSRPHQRRSSSSSKSKIVVGDEHEEEANLKPPRQRSGRTLTHHK